MTDTTRISLVRTTNRTEGVPGAINLLQSNPVKGKKVVLKPNFNTDDPAPGSTHNDTLRALILALKEMGAAGIQIVTDDPESEAFAGMVRDILLGG